jgi:hypothetical protein
MLGAVVVRELLLEGAALGPRMYWRESTALRMAPLISSSMGGRESGMDIRAILLGS